MRACLHPCPAWRAAVNELPPARPPARQLLAEVQTSLVVLQGEPSHAERCQHTAVAALALLGGLEELCALGVPLQVLLHVNSAALVALGPGQHSTALCGPERAGDSFARVALQFCDFVLVLSQFWLEAQMLDESLAAQRGSRAAYPDPAGELRRLQTMLFHEVFGMSVQCCIALVQCGVPRLALPSMDQASRSPSLIKMLCAEGVGVRASPARRPVPHRLSKHASCCPLCPPLCTGTPAAPAVGAARL